MSLADLAPWVSVAASLALVVSVALLLYNMRESRRAAKQNLAFSMLERLTSAEFAERRWKMHHSVETAAAKQWAGFDDSLEDFESRAFAYQYELIGQLTLAGVIDYELVRDFLQFSVNADWRAFDPLDAHLLERYPGHVSPWTRFHALAERITADLKGPPLPTRIPSEPLSPP